MPRRTITNDHLGAVLYGDKTAADLAREHGVSRQAVSERIRRERERENDGTLRINAMREPARCLQRVNLLQDACDEWLRDPHDPTRYDIGVCADELFVVFRDADADGRRFRRHPTRSASPSRPTLETQARMNETRVSRLGAPIRRSGVECGAAFWAPLFDRRPSWSKRDSVLHEEGRRLESPPLHTNRTAAPAAFQAASQLAAPAFHAGASDAGDTAFARSAANTRRAPIFPECLNA